MLKTLTNTLNIVFVAVLLGVSGLFIATLFPLPGNIEAKIVQSGSMHPAMPVGSLIILKPVASYGVGDVITFGPDTKAQVPTTHRIVAIESSPERGGAPLYRVKGDANEEPDTQLVPHSLVIGKVFLSVPYAGFVLDFARQPLGFGLLIGLPALIVILDELVNIFVEVKRLRQRVPSKRSSGRSLRQPALSERSSGRPSGSTRPLPQAQVGFAEIRAVYTRRRVSEDMFVRTRKATLMLLAAFGLSSSLLLGSVGSTFSYFTDIERSLANFLRAGEWGEVADPFDIVLNEFLPNPDNSANGLNFGDDGDNKPFGEWVELYNNGDVPVDVAGWFLTDASGGGGNTHAVITGANTNTGLTIVPAHGWLVVYMNKPTLNNTDDEIRLFMSSSTEIDMVSYGQPSDFCEFELTPGTGNAGSGSGVPGNGNQADCNQALVAPNKSYARIPDGTGAWIDPIPTPGAPNTLDENAAFEEFLVNEPDTGPTNTEEPVLEVPADEEEEEAASSTPELPTQEPTPEPQEQPQTLPQEEVDEEEVVAETPQESQAEPQKPEPQEQAETSTEVPVN